MDSTNTQEVKEKLITKCPKTIIRKLAYFVDTRAARAENLQKGLAERDNDKKYTQKLIICCVN